MRVSETGGRGSRAPVRFSGLGWFAGPLAATCALALLAVVWLGLFTSGGGLLIALGVAFWAGWGTAALVDPQRPWRHAIIVAAYLLVLLSSYIAFAQSQPVPPGTSSGGANVPPRR